MLMQDDPLLHMDCAGFQGAVQPSPITRFQETVYSDDQGKSTMMSTAHDLVPLLQRLNYHQVRRMARTLGAPAPADRIDHWRAAVAGHWADPARTAQTLAHLPVAARTALSRLLALGSAPLSLIVGEYGSLRLHRPRREPSSVTELLYERGLLYPTDNRPWSRTARLGIPGDLISRLQPHVPSDLLPSLPPPTGRPETPLALLHDMSRLLILCLTPGVCHQPAARWLKPTALQQLKQQLRRPLALPPRPTHKQIPYLRRLMLLAVAAELLHQGEVTPAGWRWLAESPVDQWRMLVYAWRDAGPTLRHSYQGGDEPPTPPSPWLPTLWRYLARQPAAFTPATLTHTLVGQEAGLNTFFTAHFESLAQVDRAIEHACTWLSLLGLVETVVPVAAGGEDDAQPQITQISQILDHGNPDHPLRPEAARRSNFPAAGATTGVYRLTPAGRWLLATDESAADETLAPAENWTTTALLAETVFSEDDATAWRLALPWRTQPALVARLARYTEQKPAPIRVTAGGEALHELRLTPASLAHATAHGDGLPALVETLAALGVCLTPAQQATLAAWSAQGGQPRLLWLPVLQTDTPAQLAQLYAQAPLVAHLLGDPLSRTTAPWHGELEAAVLLLRKAGFAPSVGALAPPIQQQAAAGATLSGALAGPAAGQLWLAAQLYTVLGRYLALPLPMPTALVQALYAQISPAQQAALHLHLETLTQSLADLLDGGYAPAPPQPGDPDRWRPHLEQAIADEQPVELRYWSAGRNLVTQRTVTPAWIEERRGVAYLRGECHTSGKFLLFRLDRIMSVERRT